MVVKYVMLEIMDPDPKYPDNLQKSEMNLIFYEKSCHDHHAGEFELTSRFFFTGNRYES